MGGEGGFARGFVSCSKVLETSVQGRGNGTGGRRTEDALNVHF